MKVSIITVCFNSESTIRFTIESVLSQRDCDIEYIVIDGGSTDNTLTILGEYGDSINVLVSEPDAGIYDAMNKGISRATGHIVGILNSDDLYESYDSVSKIVSVFDSSPNLQIVFGDVVFVDSLDLHRVIRFYSSRSFKPWKLRFGWMPPHPATFALLEVYKKYGNYSLEYKISSDYEIFIRWLLVDKVVWRRVEQIVVRMRMGGASTSGVKSSLKLNSEIVRACRSNGIYTNFFLLLIKVPFKLFEFLRKPKGLRNV